MKGLLKCGLWIMWMVTLWPVSPLCALDRGMPSGPYEIEADSISFDRDSETYDAEGDVTIYFAGGYLKADSLVLRKISEKAIAEGNVMIADGADRMEGQRVEFNMADKSGIISDGKIFIEKNHLYLSGKKIEKKGDATYSLEEATVTTCDGDNPDWKITGERIDVTIDGYGTMTQGFFKVKDVPILYVPYMIFPAKTTRQSGLLYPRIAYSRDKLGLDLEIPLYWAISDEADATFYQRYMDKRGFQEGVEFRYCLGTSSFGTFYADFMNDHMDIVGVDETGSLFRDWEGGQKRWSYYLDHETRFDSGVYLKASLKKVSDNWYFKDFDSHNYYLAHYDAAAQKRFSRVPFYGDKALPMLRSSVRLVKDWRLFNVTAQTQYTDNFQSYSNDDTLQKYPEITLTGIEQPLGGTPFHIAMESFYGYYYRTAGQRGHLFDMAPVLSLPIRVGSYFSFTPEIGVRETVWDSEDTSGLTSGSHKSREVYHIAATLDSEVQRVFHVGGQSVDKIRHSIRPEITYRYVPNVEKADRPDFVDAVDEENRLLCALTNTLTARVKGENGAVSYREVLNLKLNQAYDIHEAKRNPDPGAQKRRPFSEIGMELDVSPNEYFYADIDSIYNVNAGECEEFNSAVTVLDARGDSAVFEYRYTQDELEELNLYLKAKVTERVGLNYVMRTNKMDNLNLETSCGVTYQKQCWQVTFEYRDSYDDREFMCIFSLFGLGNDEKTPGTGSHDDL